MPAFTPPKVFYKGFSTARYESRGKAFLTTDLDLVKTDLLNHIFTTPTERVMMPRFGTRIPLLAFEPLDQITLDIIDEDLRMVFNYDPRVVLLNLSIAALPNNNAVVASATLRYVEFDVIDDLHIEVPTGE